MTESKFWKYIRPNLWGHSERIENSTGSGIPDVNTCFQGQEVWIELKIITGYQFHLRRTQYNWINRRLKEQGRIFILIGHKRNKTRWTGELITGEDLIKAIPTSEKEQYYLYNLEDVKHRTFPSIINWSDLNNVVYLDKNI